MVGFSRNAEYQVGMLSSVELLILSASEAPRRSIRMDAAVESFSLFFPLSFQNACREHFALLRTRRMAETDSATVEAGEHANVVPKQADAHHLPPPHVLFSRSIRPPPSTPVLNDGQIFQSPNQYFGKALQLWDPRSSELASAEASKDDEHEDELDALRQMEAEQEQATKTAPAAAAQSELSSLPSAKRPKQVAPAP